MNTLFDTTFAHWTAGFDPLQARISVFHHLRDLPYTKYVGLCMVDWMQRVLETKRGSCIPKHYILNAMFRRLGIEVKYLACPNLWKDQPLELPQELRKLGAKLPVVCHLASKALINNTWVQVDATFDLPLARIGAPVTVTWDGLQETPLAVVPLEVIEQDTEEEHIAYQNKLSQGYTSEDAANIQAFAAGLNVWLDAVRNGTA